MRRHKTRKNKKVTKKTTRKLTKYPGLGHSTNLKIRWEELDQDYIDKLSEEEKAWLNSFNEETISTNFKHEGKKLYKTKKAKRELYSKNNARNRCAYSRAKAKGFINDMVGDGIRLIREGLDVQDNTYADKEYLEDALIDYIDNKKKVK